MINSAARSQLSGKKWYRNISAGNPLYSEMELISTTLITSNTASVTFDVTGLGSSYKHLQIRCVNRTNDATFIGNITMRFNSDSGTNYWNHFLNGAGSTVSSFEFQDSQAFVGQSAGTSASGGIYNAFFTDIVDAFSSTKKKTIRSLFGTYVASSDKQVGMISNLWNSTSAITSVSVLAGSSSFIAGSRFSIYGIKG